MKRVIKKLLFVLPALPPLLFTPPVAAQALKTFPGDSLKETGRVFSAPLRLFRGGAGLVEAITAADLLAYKF